MLATLFGFHAKGTAYEDSDGDIIVYSDLRGFCIDSALLCGARCAESVGLDSFAKYEVTPGGKADLEIRKWGM